MLYKLVRILLGAGIITALLLFLKKRRKWQIRVPAILVALIFYGVLCVFPLENLFFSFPTPEAAYSYQCETPIRLIVPGEKSCMIRSDKGDIFFIVKGAKGWKLGNNFLYKTADLSDNGILVSIDQYGSLGDCYLTVTNAKGGPLTIQDTRNSRFLVQTTEAPSLNQTFYAYYTAVRDIDSSYTLTIDGEVWPVGEKFTPTSYLPGARKIPV